MHWKFWQNSANKGRQSGSRTIPEPVARYMVVDMRKEAEWVWHLMAVERPRPEAGNEYEVRVYEARRINAANVRVRDYSSLDNFEELIVLQGTYNRKTGDVRPDPAWEPSLKAA